MGFAGSFGIQWTGHDPELRSASFSVLAQGTSLILTGQPVLFIDTIIRPASQMFESWSDDMLHSRLSKRSFRRFSFCE